MQGVGSAGGWGCRGLGVQGIGGAGGWGMQGVACAGGGECRGLEYIYAGSNASLNGVVLFPASLLKGWPDSLLKVIWCPLDESKSMALSVHAHVLKGHVTSCSYHGESGTSVLECEWLDGQDCVCPSGS